MLLCHGWLSAGYHINLERIQTPAIWNLTSLRHHLPGLTNTPWSGSPRPVPCQDRWLPSLVALLCHLCHVIYCLLVIFRQQHGMPPGLLWFTLTHRFTANKHNNLSHFSVLEALEGPGLRSGWKHLRRGQLTATSRWCAGECLQRANKGNTRKQLCMTLERNMPSCGPKYTHRLDQRD